MTMGNYDEYRAKILKFNDIKNKILKFKILIISTLSLIVVLTIGYLSSIGTITKNVSIENHIVYGEKYDFEKASVLFSKASYQFSLKGSNDWSEEQPTDVGTYYIRTVTKKAFGIKKYGPNVEFAIGVKDSEIEINDNSIIYGNDPSNITIDLVAGDKVESIGYTYEDVLADKTNITIDSSQLKIVNQSGKDVTSFYNFICQEKNIEIKNRDIELTPNVQSFEYNGETINYEGCLLEQTSNRLAFNDVAKFDYVYKDSNGNILENEPSECGNYTCSIVSDSITISNGEKSSLSKYNLKFKDANFTITPRNIDIETPSSDKGEYDGEYYSNTSIPEVNNLVVGDKVVLDDLQDFTKVVDAGTYQNIVAYKIINKDNKDVTKNYKINYNYGTLNIYRRLINVTPYSLGVNEYDGQSRTYSSSDSNYESLDKNLVEGQSLRINIGFKEIDNPSSVLSFIKNKGVYQYALLDYVINNGKKSNYSIVLKDTTTEITPRTISIKPISFGEDTIYSGSTYSYSTSFGNFEYCDDSKTLVDGERIKITPVITNEDGVKFTNIKNVGYYTIKINTQLIIGSSSTLLDNYTINVQDESFVINKKDLVVTPDVSYIDGNSIYDGNDHSYYSSINNFIYEGLVNGEQFIGEVQFNKDQQLSSKIKDAGTYELSLSLQERGNGYLENYNITYQTQTYTIEKRNVVLLPDSSYINGNLIYNGEAYTYMNKEGNFVYPYNISALNQFVTGESVNISVKFTKDGSVVTPIDADTYSMSINSVTYGSNTKASNYNLTFEDAVFTINPRDIYIQPKTVITDSTKQYDGKVVTYNYSGLGNFDYQNYTDKVNQLVPGQNIEIVTRMIDEYYTSVTPQNVGYYKCQIVDIIYGSTTKASNYNINTNEVDFFITERKVQIKPNVSLIVGDTTYDGEIKTYQNVDNNFVLCNSTTLVDGETFQVELGYIKDGNEVDSLLNAGSYTLYIKDIVEGTGLLTNYEFTYNNENYKINKRKVYIAPLPYEGKEYDGIEFTYENRVNNFIYPTGTSENNKLVAREEILVNPIIYNQKTNQQSVAYNAGDYSIKINDSCIIGISADLNNYTFVYSSSEFIITPRKITIAPNEGYVIGSASMNYDGNYRSYINSVSNFDVESPNGLVSEDNFSISVTFSNNSKKVSSFVDAGTYYLEIASVTPYQNTLLSNYDITYSDKEVTYQILPRSVTILPDSSYINGNLIYDGEAYTYMNKEGNFVYPYNISALNQFVTGESVNISVKFTKDGSVVTPIDADTYSMSINSVTYGSNTKASNYNLTYEDAIFTINPRDIYIQPKTVITDSTKQYDGKVVTYNYSGLGNFDYQNYTDKVNQLVPGQNIEIVTRMIDEYYTSATPQNVGYYKCQIVDIIYGSTTKASNYNINTNEVDFFITERKVQIKPNVSLIVGDTTYDGEIKTYQNVDNNFVLCNSTTLVDGETFQVELGYIKDGNEADSLLNAGTYTLYIKDIVEGTGLLTNYEFTYQTDKYVISPRSITINTLIPDTQIYTGRAYVYPDEVNNFTLVQGSIVSGDLITISVTYYDINRKTTTSSPYEVGVYDIYYDDFEISTDEKENYTITQRDVYQLDIIRKDIVVSPFDIDDYMYDGSYATYDDSYGNYELISAAGYSEIPLFKIMVEFKDIATDEIFQNGMVKDVGTYEILIKEVIFADPSLTNSYNIIAAEDYPTFSITPRNVKVNIFDASKTYDGNEYAYNNVAFTLSENQMVAGERISVSVKYEDSKNNIVTPINAGTYKIIIDKVEPTNSDTLLTNYDFDITTTKELIIDKRIVTIMPIAFENLVYDGNEVIYESDFGNYTYEALSSYQNQFVTGEEIKTSVIMTSSEGVVVQGAINAGTYELSIDEESYVPNSKTLLDNYIINTLDVSFEIAPKAVSIIPTISMIDGLSYYDGETRIYKEIAGNNIVLDANKANGLVDDDLFMIKVEFIDINLGETSAYALNSGSYELNIDSIVPVGDTLLSNYSFDKQFITYTLNRRLIQVGLNVPESHVYDGKYYSYPTNEDNYKITGELQLVPGDTLSLIIYTDGEETRKMNVGIHELSLYDYSMNTNKNNYQIVLDESSRIFEIYKKTLSIDLLDIDNSVFNDSVQDNYDYAKKFENIDGIIEGEELNIEIIYYQNYVPVEPLHVGTYTYGINLDNSFVIGNNSTIENYTLVYEYKTFIITPQVVKLSLVDQMMTYCGENFVYPNEFTVIEGDLFSSTIALTVNYYKDGQLSLPKNAGEYVMTCSQIDFTSGEPIDYDISFDETIHTLTINKAELEITIQDKEGVYSGSSYQGYTNTSYDVTAGQIYESSKIYINEYVYRDDEWNRCKPINVGEYTVDTEMYEMVNGLLDNYDVTVIAGTLTIVKQTVYVTPLDIVDKKYDDTIYEYPSYFGNYIKTSNTESDVRFNITLKFVKDGVDVEEVRDAGIYTYSIDSFNTFNGLNDNYELVLNKTYSFTIQRRSITVYTGGEDNPYIYDGLAHSITDQFRLDSSSKDTLVNNHYFELDITTEIFFVTNVGEYDNQLQACIRRYDADKTIVTDNYDITYVYGKLIILPRPLTIETSSLSTYYQAKNIKSSEFEITSGTLVDNQTIEVASNPICKDVGIYDNALVLQISGLDDSNKTINTTSNYDITYVYGQIEITPIDLEINFSDTSSQYNGDKQIYKDYKVSSILSTQPSINFKYEIIKNGIVVTEVLNVGIYQLHITNLKVENIPLEDVKNFNVIVNTFDVTYEILKVDVQIVEKGCSFLYTGDEHQLLDYGLVDSIDPKFTIEQLDSSLQPSVIEPVYDENLVNVGVENKILLRILLNEEDVSDNFNIIYTNKAYIRVTNTLEIDFGTITTYNNAEYTQTSSKTTKAIDHETQDNINELEIRYNFRVVDEDGITITPKDAGIYKIEILSYTILRNGEDLTDKYIVTDTLNCELTIFACVVNIKPIDLEKYYDGVELKCSTSEFEYLEENIQTLYDDVILNIETSQSLTNAGKRTNNKITSISLFNSETMEELIPIQQTETYVQYQNYFIYYFSDDTKQAKYYYGTLKVNKRDIEITTYGGEKVYDGTPLYVNDYQLVEKDEEGYGLINNEYLELREEGFKFIKVGTSVNKLRFDCYLQNGTLGTIANYNITYTEGDEYLLVITPRQITITSASATKEYDGNYLTNTEYTITGDGLADNQTIQVEIVGKQQVVGTSMNTFDEDLTVIRTSTGSNVTKYYEITYVEGTLEVTYPKA